MKLHNELFYTANITKRMTMKSVNLTLDGYQDPKSTTKTPQNNLCLACIHIQMYLYIYLNVIYI